jgi:hypothetical protein
MSTPTAKPATTTAPTTAPTSNQGYTVVTVGPTPAPGKTYPPDWNWNTPPNWDTIKVNVGWDGRTSRALDFPEELKPVLSVKATDDSNSRNNVCPQPQDPNMPDVRQNMSDILKSAGGDQKCVQTFDLIHSDTSGSARAQLDGVIVNAAAEAKFQTNSTTDKKTQSGCTTLIVKASTIITKQLAMQCIVNNCQSEQTITTGTNARVLIETLELTPDEKRYKAELLQSQLQQLTDVNTNDSNIIAGLIERGVPTSQLDAFAKFSSERINMLKEAQKQQLSLYTRDVNIKDSSVIAKANQKLSVQVVLSSDAKNKLSTLAESISKDVAEMQVSNKLGVNATTPNVKNIVAQAMAKSSSTASSSITNISNKTTISSGTDGTVIISAPGTINITNSVIEANAISNIVIQQILTQAVSNGMDIASKILTDNKSVQSVLNDVKGLDDFQKAVAETLRTGTDASPDFGGGSGSFLKMALIGGAVLIGVVVVLNMMPKSGQSPPQSRFRALGDIAYKLRYKMGPKPFPIEAMLGLAIILSLLVGGLFFLLKKK